MYVTEGEHLYVQVKGTENIERGKYKVYERTNVEKGKWKKGKHYEEIDVIKFSLETSELLTVEKMGSAVPVLLFVVDVKTENIYYICLNDYIEKVILPENKRYMDPKSKTIYIPCHNVISKTNNNIMPLKWYAKRAKMFAMFNKVNYQREELKFTVVPEILEQSVYFADVLIRMDIWEMAKYWSVLCCRCRELLKLKNANNLNELMRSESYQDEGNEKSWYCDGSGEMYTLEETRGYSYIIELWNALAFLGGLYEDVCKEWFMPTYMGLITRENNEYEFK